MDVPDLNFSPHDQDEPVRDQDESMQNQDELQDHDEPAVTFAWNMYRVVQSMECEKHE